MKIEWKTEERENISQKKIEFLFSVPILLFVKFKLEEDCFKYEKD